MNKIKISEAVIACGGKLLKGDGEKYIKGACIDSRIAVEGDLFAAIKGENTDGHKYLKQVSDKGAAAVLISDEAFADDAECAVILCEDTTKGLQDIAKAYRNMLSMKIVGVTGSVGKTSTADMVKAVCSVKYKTAKTKGNFNNHLGLPLTLLSFDPDTEVGILEMGMDKLGEIDFLASLARPDIGIITNVGMAHIENLGSRENIFKAKMEITNYFDENNILVVNGEDEYLSTLSKAEYKIDKVGTKGGCRFFLYDVKDLGEEGIAFTFEYNEKTVKVAMPVYGLHNALNASLALSAGLELGVAPEDAAKGLAALEITDKRLSIKGKNGIKIIDDTYNASPDSMKSAIDVLVSTKGIRKIAILGDMFELGSMSESAHRDVGKHAAASGIDMLISIGNDSAYISEEAKSGIKEVKHFEDKETFYTVMDETIVSGDVVLLKGSNGMHMDQIVKKIMER